MKFMISANFYVLYNMIFKKPVCGKRVALLAQL